MTPEKIYLHEKTSPESTQGTWWTDKCKATPIEYIRKDIHDKAIEDARDLALHTGYEQGHKDGRELERERCAKVAENLPPITINRKAHRQACEDIAKAIRGDSDE